MQIYELKKRYDVRTGELLGRELIQSHHRCDFTGTRLGEEGYTSDSYARYFVDYGGNDGMYGSYGDESVLREKYGINAFMLQDSCFEIREDSQEEFKRAFCESDCKSFDAFLRETRASTVLRLIEEEGFEPYLFDGFEGEGPEDIIW